MSISRAFTTRRVKQSIHAAEQGDAPHRSNSIRHKISSPIELVHTTNMLSYNAPDIHPMSATSTGSSQRSDDDMSDSALTSGTTPPTSPDVESSPGKRALSPEPNHLSVFFSTAGQQQTRAPASQSSTPVVPQRAPSQPKKYNTLVRQRSESGMSQQSHRTVSTKASFSFSRSSSTSTSTSVSTSSAAAPTYHKSKLSTAAAAAAATPPPAPAPYSPAAAPPPRPQPPTQQHQHQHQHSRSHQQHRKEYSEAQHPFGLELAQVSEIAEEYGIKEHLASSIDMEEQEMRAKGLFKFSADEYLSEVRGLFAGFIISAPRPVAAAWI